MTICAVIPAAGYARRLAADGPKILVPVHKQKTIWTILENLLAPSVDHIHVVLSTFAEEPFLKALQAEPSTRGVSTSIQERPIGMGDAIFGAYPVWSGFERLLVVWGDQVNLSRQTIEMVVKSSLEKGGITLPLTMTPDPYVQYMIENERLVDVRQTREGVKTDAIGASDVGLFVFSVDGLNEQWQKYLKLSQTGAANGEINFLPFITYLSSEAHWPLHTVMVQDNVEARGINTPDDLIFARRKFERS